MTGTPLTLTPVNLASICCDQGKQWMTDVEASPATCGQTQRAVMAHGPRPMSGKRCRHSLSSDSV